MNLVRFGLVISVLFKDVTMIHGLRRACLRPARASYSSLSCAQGRVPSNGASLDTNLLATNPEIVTSHLKSRRSNPSLLDDVAKIANLRKERNLLIVKGDAAKGIRKSLSQQIGQLMKEGKAEEVAELKRQVEDASATAGSTDEELAKIDAAINRLFSVLPNLLDDRCADKLKDSLIFSVEIRLLSSFAHTVTLLQPTPGQIL